MKADPQEIISYILNELPPVRQEEVGYLIQKDTEWKVEFERWAPVLQDLNTEKQALHQFDDIPNHYWNNFLPRVRERIDEKEQKRSLFKDRFFQAAPSFGLAVLMLFFLHNVLVTNQKIDYLLEQYNWVSSLNSSEIIDQYINQNVSAADEIITELTNGDEDNAVLADWEGAYNPTEFLDDNGLTTEEQKELLQNLEKTKTTF